MQKLEDEMKGKIVIVTGGNKGIGHGVAKAFCYYGAHVVIAGRDGEAGVSVQNELSALGGGSCVFYRCDVSNAGEVRVMVEYTVAKFGRLDCIVNNAGYLPKRRLIDDITEDDFEHVLRTNLIGMFSGCKYAMPYLRESKGSVINISSILGSVGQEGSSIYTATKGAITAMTKSLAIDEAQNGVRINVVLPGNIATDLGKEHRKHAGGDPSAAEKSKKGQWIRWQGDKMDTAWICVFLASSMAGYMTGAEVNVTGGFELGNGIREYTM